MTAENLIHRRELRVHDPATVDGEIRFEGQGDYSGMESAPSVGPCFGSTVSVREFSITTLT